MKFNGKYNNVSTAPGSTERGDDQLNNIMSLRFRIIAFVVKYFDILN